MSAIRHATELSAIGHERVIPSRALTQHSCHEVQSRLPSRRAADSDFRRIGERRKRTGPGVIRLGRNVHESLTISYWQTKERNPKTLSSKCVLPPFPGLA